MNNYGVIVNDIGFAEMLDMLQRDVLLPLAQCVFAQEADYFHTHHSFVVQYKVPPPLCRPERSVVWCSVVITLHQIRGQRQRRTVRIGSAFGWPI